MVGEVVVAGPFPLQNLVAPTIPGPLQVALNDDFFLEDFKDRLDQDEVDVTVVEWLACCI